MAPQFEENITRFARAFLPIMHIFHNLAGQVVKLTDFSLAQYRVLMLVHRRGSMSVNQLKESLNIAQSTASGMIDRLVQQKHLYRRKHPHDRRVTLFKLTPKTEKKLQEHLSSMENIYRNILEPLTPAEQRQLVESFETILALLQKSAGEPPVLQQNQPLLDTDKPGK